MFAFLPLAIATLPALVLVWLFKKWDEKRPEPPGMIRRAMIFGALSCIPAALIELLITAVLGKGVVQAQGQLVNSFAIAAGTEEASKLAIVMLYFWRKQEFNEVMDGILYTAATSLGFALLENLMYAGGNVVLGFARAISAVPLHACASGIMGYFVGRARMTGSVTSRVLTGYAAAVAIHGLYDWSVFSGGLYGFASPQPALGFLIAVVIVVVSGFVLRGLVKRALAHDDRLLGPHARPLMAFAPVPVPYGNYAQPPYAQPPYAQPYAQPPYAQPYAQPPYAQPPYAHTPVAQGYAPPGPQPHAGWGTTPAPQADAAPNPYATTSPAGTPPPQGSGWGPGRGG